MINKIKTLPAGGQAWEFTWATDIASFGRHIWLTHYTGFNTQKQCSLTGQQWITYGFYHAGDWEFFKPVLAWDKHPGEAGGYHTGSAQVIAATGYRYAVIAAHNSPLIILKSPKPMPRGDDLKPENQIAIGSYCKAEEWRAWEERGYIQSAWSSRERGEKARAWHTTYPRLYRYPYDDRYIYLTCRGAAFPRAAFADMAFGSKLLRIDTATDEIVDLGEKFGDYDQRFVTAELRATSSIQRLAFTPTKLVIFTTIRAGVAGATHDPLPIVLIDRQTLLANRPLPLTSRQVKEQGIQVYSHTEIAAVDESIALSRASKKWGMQLFIDGFEQQQEGYALTAIGDRFALADNEGVHYINGGGESYSHLTGISRPQCTMHSSPSLGVMFRAQRGSSWDIWHDVPAGLSIDSVDTSDPLPVDPKPEPKPDTPTPPLPPQQPEPKQSNESVIKTIIALLEKALAALKSLIQK